MSVLAERVSLIEGRVEEQRDMIQDVRAAVASLEARMDHRFDRLELRSDQRFMALDGRLDKMTHLLVGLLVAVVAGLGGVIAAILRIG